MNIQLIDQSIDILTSDDHFNQEIEVIERMGRLCREGKFVGGDESTAFAGRLIGRHHESVLRHAHYSVILTTDRAIANQIVRHQPGTAYTQGSQRYINFEVRDIPYTFIKPADSNLVPYYTSGKGRKTLEMIASTYKDQIEFGTRPEDARSILPMMSATKLGMTLNLQAWRNIFRERLNKAAQRNCRAIMYVLFKELCNKWPELFQDLDYYITDVEHIIPNIKVNYVTN